MVWLIFKTFICSVVCWWKEIFYDSLDIYQIWKKLISVSDAFENQKSTQKKFHFKKVFLISQMYETEFSKLANQLIKFSSSYTRYKYESFIKYESFVMQHFSAETETGTLLTF